MKIKLKLKVLKQDLVWNDSTFIDMILKKDIYFKMLIIED